MGGMRLVVVVVAAACVGAWAPATPEFAADSHVTPVPVQLEIGGVPAAIDDDCPMTRKGSQQ